MEELIKKWKEYNIEKAEFQFYAGGDSMGDTDLMFYDKDSVEVDVEEDFKGKIEDQIYKNVEFYENSDGHYQGESGTVYIELEEDELQYTKDAQSEYSVSYSDTIKIELTKEEHDFVVEHISDVADDDVDNIYFLYSKDFYMTDEMEAIEKSIASKMYEAYQDHEFEHTDDDGDTGDYVTISDLDVHSENKISFSLNYQVTEYEDSN